MYYSEDNWQTPWRMSGRRLVGGLRPAQKGWSRGQDTRDEISVVIVEVEDVDCSDLACLDERMFSRASPD